ncbi:MAG TPA: hypothetical protein VMK83_03555 [Gaiellaceae bacterium]|nr:hypothetical protein [Gaiellaceae bacterium]
MRIRRISIRSVLLVACALLAIALAGCGGGDDAASEDVAEIETAETQPETAETTDEAEADSAGGAAADGPAHAPGQGTLVLDDGRSFAITVTECEGEPAGTFSASGTSVEGSEFEIGNFYLGENWSQSQASLQFPNGDQIYVIVSRVAEGADPATVDGSTLTWTQTFRELDESANQHVYTGEGVVRLTCP